MASISLDVLFLLLPVILSSQEGIKIEWQKKVNRKLSVRDITFFEYTPSFLFHFFLLSSSTPSSSQMTYLLNGPYKDTYY